MRWVPSAGCFCGDLLFNAGTPFVLMGSVPGAIEVLTEFLAPIPAEVIVPGHGVPCDAGLIDDAVGYLRFVLETARAGIDAGLTPLELARDVELGEYAGWLDPERIVGNLHRATSVQTPTMMPWANVSVLLRDSDGHSPTCTRR